MTVINIIKKFFCNARSDRAFQKHYNKGYKDGLQKGINLGKKEGKKEGWKEAMSTIGNIADEMITKKT